MVRTPQLKSRWFCYGPRQHTFYLSRLGERQMETELELEGVECFERIDKRRAHTRFCREHPHRHVAFNWENIDTT